MKTLCQNLDILSIAEIKKIEQAAFRILDQVGVIVEHPKLRQVLADSGARLDPQSEKVFFSERYLQDFLARVDPSEPAAPKDVRATGGIGGYALNYLNPETRKIEPQTVDSVRKLIVLGDYLENCSGINLAGVPSDIPSILVPLYGRYLLWRHTQQTFAGDGLIWDVRLCPYILEMAQTMSEAKQKDLKDYLHVCLFLISPLKLGKEEAEQYVWFWEHGLYAHVAHMNSIGGTGPATIAGTLAVWLAEQFFLCILDRVFYQRRKLYMGAAIHPLDMRHATYPYGRPEGTLAGLAATAIVRHYKADGGGGAGHGTNSKGVDFESGLQLGAGAVLNMLTAGAPGIGMSLISVDEVASPEMMVITNEFCEHLNRLLKGFEINDETLALDVIREVGCGGLFTDHEHTVAHHRDELWMPKLFCGEMLASWQRQQKSILDKAREVCLQVWKSYTPCGMDESTEKRLLRIVDNARRALVSAQ